MARTRALALHKGGSKNGKAPKTHIIEFTVDAALLRELGERLVGKPYIALAELIKNSYDADATLVKVSIDSDRIIVEDDGNGMTFDEFSSFWMRIGSPHKQKLRQSRKFKRPLTGSKGVGRLAVQFLGRRLRLDTSARRRGEINASVDWDEAVSAGDLTKASAEYREYSEAGTYAKGSRHGTRIEIRNLNHIWTPDSLKSLAQELWDLQPPFQEKRASSGTFRIELTSPNRLLNEAFNRRMQANLDLWSARIRGQLLPPNPSDKPGTRRFSIGLQFKDGGRAERLEFPIEKCALNEASYDIRIFSLYGKQRFGVAVDKARKYLLKYGGVHIYDAGFHLPYYGHDNDWLRIEIDHSHRKSASSLLPRELQVSGGMSNLPTQSRIFGVVHVNTTHERTIAQARKRSDFLQVQVSRDRLVDNLALENLRYMIRFALDFYAVRETERKYENFEPLILSEPKERLERVDALLARYEREIPEPIYEDIKASVRSAIRAEEQTNRVVNQQAGLLGALATAGIGALAYDHEAAKQVQILQDLVSQLGDLRIVSEQGQLKLRRLIASLNAWIENAKATRALFLAFSDEENRAPRQSTKAKALVDEVIRQVTVLTRGISFTTNNLDGDLRLPAGSFSEWSAIFQNVFINASNALLDSEVRRIDVSSDRKGDTYRILVQDTGSGVDLENATQLFEPFVRAANISPERRALGLGGSGLGLAIVKMIAISLNCSVYFAEPAPSYSTAFVLSWEVRL